MPLALQARISPSDTDPVADANFWWVLMLGRLKPGIRVEEARDALDVLLKRTVASAKPALSGKDLPRVDLLPGGRGQVEDRDAMRQPLRIMAIVTAIVLLVACANVASLLLARGRSRVRELSIRVAIGAPRRRVVRQLLTEAVLLALAGGAIGVVLATWIGEALAPALSDGSDATEILTHLNLLTLGFAIATACAAAILFGLIPAFRATDLHVGAGLQAAGRGATNEPRRRVLSGGLVVVQIALSLLLIAGAGLMVQTVWNLQHVDLGFDASNLLLFRINPSLSGYDPERTTEIYTQVLDRVRATPGVQAASLSSHKLISQSSAIGTASRVGEPAPAPGSAEVIAFSKTHSAWNLVVDERFFETLGIKLVRGRTFATADEGSAQVAVINQSLARQLFQTDDAVGRQFRFGGLGESTPSIHVIGVVQDARYTSMRENKPPTSYTYYRQHPEMRNAVTFEVRTAGVPSALTPSMREIVRAIDPNMPVYGVTTQTDQIALSLRPERLFARLAGVLGGVAVLLSAIGLYGLLVYGVARRTPEIGLRMALGAERSQVSWMILRESLMLAGVGLLLGVPAALAGTTILQSMLFGLAATDPATIGLAAGSLLILAVIAGSVPARRAARVDPMVALRAD